MFDLSFSVNASESPRFLKELIKNLPTIPAEIIKTYPKIPIVKIYSIKFSKKLNV
jgi:hypothetical protein